LSLTVKVRERGEGKMRQYKLNKLRTADNEANPAGSPPDSHIFEAGIEGS
jgi:hypothetical protein